ncbi:MAG: membrane protein insertion efficiency factor YidD [Gemmatimonadetes bacterium]|nr:membrane protein insertion efficiency factor YidD [Gemmatimonadota bacterium]
MIALTRFPKIVLRSLVLGYRALLSPILHTLMPGFGCRFHPTCSEYALQSLGTHGLFRGSWLALGRLARCHPFHPGGCDPVPPSTRRN